MNFKGFTNNIVKYLLCIIHVPQLLSTYKYSYLCVACIPTTSVILGPLVCFRIGAIKDCYCLVFV